MAKCKKDFEPHLFFAEGPEHAPEREAVQPDGGGDGVEAGTGGSALQADSL